MAVSPFYGIHSQPFSTFCCQSVFTLFTNFTNIELPSHKNAVFDFEIVIGMFGILALYLIFNSSYKIIMGKWTVTLRAGVFDTSNREDIFTLLQSIYSGHSAKGLACFAAVFVSKMKWAKFPLQTQFLEVKFEQKIVLSIIVHMLLGNRSICANTVPRFGQIKR